MLGKLIKIYPDRLPLFVLPTNYPARREGESLEVAYTHNVAFRAWLAAPDKGGLRFDESLRFRRRQRFPFLSARAQDRRADRRDRKVGRARNPGPGASQPQVAAAPRVPRRRGDGALGEDP